MKRQFWIFALSGACANFACLGIARYSYPPMIPVLIKHKWLSLSQANILATVIFIGFFLSVLFSLKIVSRFPKRNVIRGSMSILVVAFIAISFNFGIYWTGFWIFTMGVQTGVIFLNAPTLLLTAVHDTRKGYLSGIMFAGIGVGVISTSYITTYVSRINVQLTWLVLALCLLIALIISWSRMPWDNSHLRDQIHPKLYKKSNIKNFPYKLVFGFFLFRMGNLSLTVYLSEYIAAYFSGSKFEDGLIAISWSLVGLGFIVGPFLFGSLSKHIGIKSALLISLAFLGSGTLLLSFGLSPWKIYIFSFFAGLGVTSSAAMFSSMNAIISPKESVYKNWQSMLIAGATSLFLGSILFEQIIIYFSYSYVFIIGAIIVYFSILLTAQATRNTNFPAVNQQQN